MLVQNEIAELVSYLEPESDELAVVSLVGKERQGRYRCLRGSVIVGPNQICYSNWHGWQREHNVRPIGQPEPGSPAYVTKADDLLAARVTATVEEAVGWLSQLAERGWAHPWKNLPQMEADLATPIAPIRISPRLDTPATTFTSSAVRPSSGFILQQQGSVGIEAPTLWTNETGTFINSPLSLGLTLNPNSETGIALCRLERRAWFSQLRGGGNLMTFECHVGLEQERIDLADLAVTLDEWIGDELVHSQQVHLEDLAIDAVRGGRSAVVNLPTLGTAVQRSLRLHDRHGTLLDASSRFSIVESVQLTVRDLQSGAETRSSVGTERQVPSFFQRADAVGNVRATYQQLFQQGVTESLMHPGADVRQALRQRLPQARGVLRVVDRHFGKDPLDWTIFDNVSVPIEVLLSQGGQPPHGTNPNIRVRRHTGGRPPFHGRAYLWDGGGFTVDASPDGFGRDLLYVRALTSQVSSAWQQNFTAWWSSARETP